VTLRGPIALLVPVIGPRAIVVWALSRLLFAALPLAIGAPFGSISPSPVAVVLLAGLVGLVDVYVRTERIFWANLGVKSIALYALYAAAAVPAEFLLALALR
jgi:hypothetical protein